MIRLVPAVVAAAAVALAGMPVLGQSGAQTSCLVTVIAEGGAPIADLSAADITVREAGDARKVVSVERAPFPLVVSVVADMTQPPPGMNAPMRHLHLRQALAAFVSAIRASSPGARIELVEVGSGTTIAAAFDAKPEDLDSAIQRLFPAHPADAVLLESFGDAARRMSDLPTPRRAIVAIDFNSSESLSEATMKRTTGALHASGATVWSVSVRSARASGSRREGALNLITKVSGGLRLVAAESSGLEAQLKKVADSLASQYIVAFERPEGGPLKEVRMETARGAKVHVSLMRR